MASRVLKTVVFQGSARNIVPPWGGDSRLGDRVMKHVLSVLKTRKSTLAGEEITHDVTVYDPLEVFGKGGPLEGDGELQFPHFFLKADDERRKKMDGMAATMKAADAYIVVSAEYNHTIPPALGSMMSHFGSANYAHKASGIITYSVGPWGGTRASIALQPFLHELGCLPVSKMTGFPTVADIFNEDGTPKDPKHRMLKQLPTMLDDLEFVATALAKMRASTSE